MKHSLICAVIMMASWLLPHQSFAQVDVGVTASALASIQPVDNWFGGSPYLNEGIGGGAPGLAASLSVIAPNGFVVMGEYSTTSAFEVLQEGRLVDTRRRFGSGMSTTRMRDSLLSGLLGYATAGKQRWLLVGGASLVSSDITEDGIPLEDLAFEGLEGGRRFALTGGTDFQYDVAPRVSILVGGRYSWLTRTREARDLGAGRHVIRLTAGARVRLN